MSSWLPYGLVGVAWTVVLATVADRFRPERPPASRTDGGSRLGLALQCAAFLLPLALPRADAPGAGTVAAATVLALSVRLFRASARALGEQWSLVARVRGAHELVTTGPYGVLRHPIYAAAAGMVLGTGLAVGRPGPCVAAAALYAAGTALRVRGEESVLRASFGRRYEAYARTVPRWLPRAGRLRAPRTLRPESGGSE